MDPIMPLHTGQTEEEGVIHRACEWSVNKSFNELINRLESGPGYPDVKLPVGDDWIRGAVHQGAELAHSHYQTFIDHYNLELGSRNPPAGLDDNLREVTSQLLGFASAGFARILERAFDESSVKPARKSSSLFAFLYQITAPVSWSFKAFCHLRDRGQVRKIANEVNSTGKAVRSLPRDERQVRQLHAQEILKIDLAELDRKQIKPVGSKSTAAALTNRNRGPKRQSRSERQAIFRLELDSPLERAPSIGPKTARRFEKVGIKSVGDFLSADPQSTATTLDTRHISPDTVRQWQVQSRLACQIPRIYGHDAQILAACGFENADEVASSQPEQVLSLVEEFSKTEEARFILRSGKQPDLQEVSNWIEWSQQSRRLNAA